MKPLPLPVRLTDRLHIGRISNEGAGYFVTFVTASRKPWLAHRKNHAVLLSVLRSWHDEQRGSVLAATVMPDHVHVLFQLGPELTVGQAVARWKSGMRKVVGYAEAFQRDFWEHRLREAEDAENYALYAYLNPYRAGLLRQDEVWPGWWAPEPAIFRFSAALDANGGPPQEWVDWPEVKFAGLAHGE